ncbi:MAG: adenylate/guanylate cyclase domain-containing protein [Deltaproteobacteria bacterium]
MLELTVSNVEQVQTFRHDDGPLLLGRAPVGAGRCFVVRDPRVSRVQLTVQEAEGGVRITNHGATLTIEARGTLATDDSGTFALPATVLAGGTKIEIYATELPEQSEGSLVLRTIVRTAPPKTLERAPTVERLAEWFQTLLSVQRAAAGSAAFYTETARAIVDLIGLDRGLVLLEEDGAWKVVAAHAADGASGDGFSQTVLNEVLRTQQTVYHRPNQAAASLVAVDAFVASPIFGARGAPIGAVFGARDRKPGVHLPAVEPLEAQVVQVLAAAVSAGLARMEREAEAGRLRVQFERVFSPKLVRELERDPTMLEPAERTITVLFTDLRGFTRLSERLDPKQIFALVGEVMDALTARVHEAGGVVIDYYGDGMAAMWNAPLAQDDPAGRACHAALAMVDDIAALDTTWRNRIGRPLSIGVGLHTGPALVGNAGSKMRQKYGPRGHTVNLASRIEGATKHAGVAILLSQATLDASVTELSTRHVGATLVVGVDDPIELYELRSAAEWGPTRDLYETAIDAFGAGDYAEAERVLETLPADDGPSRLLARNVERAKTDPTAPAVLKLETK